MHTSTTESMAALTRPAQVQARRDPSAADTSWQREKTKTKQKPPAFSSGVPLGISAILRAGPMPRSCWPTQYELNGIVVDLVLYFILFGHFCLIGLLLFILTSAFVGRWVSCIVAAVYLLITPGQSTHGKANTLHIPQA